MGALQGMVGGGMRAMGGMPGALMNRMMPQQQQNPMSGFLQQLMGGGQMNGIPQQGLFGMLQQLQNRPQGNPMQQPSAMPGTPQFEQEKAAYLQGAPDFIKAQPWFQQQNPGMFGGGMQPVPTPQMPVLMPQQPPMGSQPGWEQPMPAPQAWPPQGGMGYDREGRPSPGLFGSRGDYGDPSMRPQPFQPPSRGLGGMIGRMKPFTPPQPIQQPQGGSVSQPYTRTGLPDDPYKGGAF